MSKKFSAQMLAKINEIEPFFLQNTISDERPKLETNQLLRQAFVY
jgi:hypothetical protein